MSTIRHEVWIDAPQKAVCALLASAEAISTWWDEQTRKETAEGIVLEHSPGPDHGVVRFLVLENIPNRRVKWRCVSENPANTPASEWAGTEMLFEIGGRETSEVAFDDWAKEAPAQTVVKFQHSGWPSPSKYFAFCNKAWADVLNSLKDKAMENAGE